jgi:histone H3/H4
VRILADGDRLNPVFLSEDTQQVWIQIGDDKRSFSPGKDFAFKEKLPATVKIFWIENGQERCQDVYVEQAESGCLVEFELRKTFDDIGALLSRLASGESELDEDEEEAFADEANARIQAAASSMTDAVQDTPIRRMMRFICEIGRSQSRVSEGHWDEFRKLLLAHLTALAQEAAKGGTSSEAHCLRYFASDLKLNPFAYLVEVSGYKPFWLRDESQAESNQDWALYKESLNRIFSMCRKEKIHGVQ